MRSFSHLAPPMRLFAGDDSFAALGKELKRAGCSRAMLVCGRTLSRDAGLLEAIEAGMGGGLCGMFAGVQPQSPLPSVQAAAAQLRELRADAVVALGGGSAIVTARAASILLAESGDAASLATSRDADGTLHSPRLMAAKLPQFIIPTTPTTAMVKVGSAVTDPDRGERLALYDPKTRAAALILHPLALGGTPDGLVLAASLSTLSFAIEGLLSPAGTPLSDAPLMHSIRLLARVLPTPQPFSVETRADLVVAAILCGQGTDQTSAGLVTALSHALAAKCHLEHGSANTVLTPTGLRFNAPEAGSGLRKLAEAFGLTGDGDDLLPRVVARLDALYDGLGVPRRLRDLQVARDALADVAHHAMGDWFLRGNPRRVIEASELKALLEAAW